MCVLVLAQPDFLSLSLFPSLSLSPSSLPLSSLPLLYKQEQIILRQTDNKPTNKHSIPTDSTTDTTLQQLHKPVLLHHNDVIHISR